MTSELYAQTVCLSVEVNLSSLEDVGAFLDTVDSGYERNIVVCITGSLDVLGQWNPEKSLLCERQKTNLTKYVLQPNCIEDEDLELATLDNTATKPEFLPDQQTLSNENKVQNAWPSRFTRRSAGKPSYYSMVCRAHPVLMSTLEISRCRVHRGEQPDCSGTLYKVGDDVTFFIETWDVENTSVEIEFYQQPNEPGVNDTKNIGGSQLKFIGSARFGPFVDTYGRKAAQILNSSHRPVGDLRGK
ncbi:unnamed protein product [Trichobilharzia regenti]|nr:unnamed protein product [Trichobilharzia regenti]